MKLLTPKTSAPSLDHSIDLMRPILENGDEIICFSISESMSTCGNVMRLDARLFEFFEIVDGRAEIRFSDTFDFESDGVFSRIKDSVFAGAVILEF